MLRYIIYFLPFKSHHRWSLMGKTWLFTKNDWLKWGKYYHVGSRSDLRKLFLRDYKVHLCVSKKPCHLWSVQLCEPLRVWSPPTILRLCHIWPQNIRMIFRDSEFVDFVNKLAEDCDLKLSRCSQRTKYYNAISAKLSTKSPIKINSIYRRNIVKCFKRMSRSILIRAFIEFHVYQSQLYLTVKEITF